MEIYLVRHTSVDIPAGYAYGCMSDQINFHIIYRSEEHTSELQSR